MATEENNHLHALVDMGRQSSNGIRFSISDLSSPTTRILPTVFQDRAAISLYDAQFKPGSNVRQPIDPSVQREVIRRLKWFDETCKDFGVPEDNIAVLATEATRTAINSKEYLSAIKKETGWDVTLLSKEEEGELGAFGVVSSLASVEGLMMDLGGGSTQITWVSAEGGRLKTSSRGPISFPYGAAAVTKRLEEAGGATDSALQKLEAEMVSKFRTAYSELGVPEDLVRTAEKNGGFDLFLSGGGFRGWGYFLMSKNDVQRYPIPIINGFTARSSDFHDTSSVLSLASTEGSNIFGISDRRASQVPAVACLVNSLAKAIPNIKTISFCQGGVREGYLFKGLQPDIRAQSPLVVATMPYQPQSSHDICSVLAKALPLSTKADIAVPPIFTSVLLSALVNFMFAHSSVSKESRSAVALHSTTTGLLASAHGMSHRDRAILALLLYERWGGDLSPSDFCFLGRLRRLLSSEEVWWCRYLGRVANLLGNVYPNGTIRGKPRVLLNSWWSTGKKGKNRVSLEIQQLDSCIDFDRLEDAKQRIEKVGKKKNWIKAEHTPENETEPWGLKIDVVLRQTLI